MRAASPRRPPPSSPPARTNPQTVKNIMPHSNVALPCSISISSSPSTDNTEAQLEPELPAVSSLRRENVFKENQHPNMMMKRETKSNMLKRLPTSESSSKNSVRAPAVAQVTSDRPEPHRHKNTFAKSRFNLDLTFTPTSRPSLYPSPHPNLTPPSSPDLYPFPTLA